MVRTTAAILLFATLGGGCFPGSWNQPAHYAAYVVDAALIVDPAVTPCDNKEGPPCTEVAAVLIGLGLVGAAINYWLMPIPSQPQAQPTATPTAPSAPAPSGSDPTSTLLRIPRSEAEHRGQRLIAASSRTAGARRARAR